VYTRTYGWYWLSDEPFAWAVYHYGRWAFDPEIGWYWIPGRRWAPAWVVWSHTDDEIAWAPLPADFDDDDIGVSISVSSLPVYYWQAVPVAFFVSIDLDDHVIRDRDHIRRIVSSGEPRTVVIENNIVVNNVIDIDVVEQKSKEKVVVYEEKPAESPDAAGVAQGNAIAVFNPQVKEEPQAKPAKLKKVEEVAAEKKASGALPQEPAAETAVPAQPTEPSSTEAEAPTTEKGKKADQMGAEKKAQPEGQTAEEPQAPEEGQAVTVEEPTKKEKKKAVKTQEPAAGEEEAEQPAVEEQEQAEQPAAQKEKGSEKALEAQPEEQAPAMEEEQAQKPEKKQDQKKQCDPAVEDCPAQ
jgi:hypothetical protein